ncbi:MAG: EAL domain-containing protein, partial [Azoarcus sp.]|nr:EAL domain-containing protein [Azoarcus sp.]
MQILYVDSVAANVESMRKVLAWQVTGIQLEVTDSLAAARIRLGDVRHAPFDLWLVKFTLSDGSGIELLKMARQARLTVPVVMMSDAASYAEAVEAMQEGAQDFLLWQGDATRLSERLREIHKRYQKYDIVARERATLLEAWENLMHILGTSALVLFKLDWRTDAWKPQWTTANMERMLGFDNTVIEQTLGVHDALDEKTWLSRVHPEDREDMLAGRMVLWEQGHAQTEYRFLHREGHYIWLRDRQCLLKNAAGKVEGSVGTLQDITHDRNAALLHDARMTACMRIFEGAAIGRVLDGIIQHLEVAFPDWHAMIWLLDESSQQQHQDQQTRKVARGAIYQSGHAPAPAMAQQCHCIMEPSDTQCYLAHVPTETSCTGCPIATRRSSVRGIWSQPLWIGSDKFLGVMNFYTHSAQPLGLNIPVLLKDFAFLITKAVERTRMEQGLRQAVAVQESTSEGVVVTDLQKTIVSVNQAWCEITGYEREEAIGRTPALLRSSLHDDAFYDALWETLNVTDTWCGEIYNRRKNGEIYPQFLTIRTVRDSNNQPTHYIGVMNDRSSQKKSESEREWLAHYDPLTALPNRLLGTSRLMHAIDQSQQNRWRLALICLDVDNFKTVNDSLGPPAGDSVLKMLAGRLREQLPGNEENLVRLGGDEFMVLLENVKTSGEIARIAQRFLECVRPPFLLNNKQEVHISISLGISCYPEDGQTADTLLQHADTAMYQAKRQGRDCFCFYTPELGERALLRLNMEAHLRRALERQEFHLHYQPQINTVTHQVEGVEALMRWSSPELGEISPGHFISIAEQSNLIQPMGAWALQEACCQNRRWQDEGLPPMVMAVNVSVRQFRSQELISVVENALKASGLAPCYLEIEITESALMDAESAIATCHRLRDMGVKFSLDDFGTGYSSLTYLSRLPLNKIKIDQSFVHNITSNTTNAAIAKATIALAQSLNLSVLAEGVE